MPPTQIFPTMSPRPNPSTENPTLRIHGIKTNPHNNIDKISVLDHSDEDEACIENDSKKCGTTLTLNKKLFKHDA